MASVIDLRTCVAASALALAAACSPGAEDDEGRPAPQTDGVTRSAAAEAPDESEPEPAAGGSRMAADRAGESDDERPSGQPMAGGRDAAIVNIYEVRDRQDVGRFVDNLFERADDDENGEMTAQEYRLVAPALAQSDNDVSVEANDRNAEAAGPEGAAADENVGLSGGQSFFLMAAGEDEMLSRAELRETILARFDEADADGDGALNAEESSAFARLAMRGAAKGDAQR